MIRFPGLKPAIKKKKPKENGKNTFHPITINWSNLYRGTFARTNINQNAINTILIEKINSGKIPKKPQPPKNKITKRADIRNIFEYSPKKKAANNIPEYSTL
jgi:hypothetical protein